MNENQTMIPDKKERFQNNYILQAWLVLFMALFFGVSLAGVQAKLGPIIETNKINETMEKVPEIVLGEQTARKMAAAKQSLQIQSRSITIQKQNRKKVYRVFEARYPDGQPAGWVAKSSGQGYADKIELLFGLAPDGERMTGLFILEQKETPGLGNKIIDKSWRAQFIQKQVRQPFTVVKTGSKRGNEIDAITGATISSRSVVDIINQTIADINGELASQAAAPKTEKKDG